MNAPFEIIVRQSFGPLRNGSLPEDVRLAFGRCDEEEEMDNGDGAPTALVWHYWDSGVSFFFDLSDKLRLSCIETSSEQTTIFGHKVFGFGEKDLIQIFSANGFFSPEEEIHEWGEKRISYEDAGIDFYFEKGKLLSVNFSFPAPGNESFA